MRCGLFGFVAENREKKFAFFVYLKKTYNNNQLRVKWKTKNSKYRRKIHPHRRSNKDILTHKMIVSLHLRAFFRSFNHKTLPNT